MTTFLRTRPQVEVVEGEENLNLSETELTFKESVEVPVMAPLCDSEGVHYWHANLMLFGNTSLGDIARVAYESNPTPELEEALNNLPLYFVVDEEGAPRSPANPARVFL